MVNQMVAIGESRIALDSMLGKVADFFEAAEVDDAVEALQSLMGRSASWSFSVF